MQEKEDKAVELRKTLTVLKRFMSGVLIPYALLERTWIEQSGLDEVDLHVAIAQLDQADEISVRYDAKYSILGIVKA
ncbi:MAG TPA: hypothetical protein VF920_04805 [Dongiaceae bacterium]